jgi:hypothetical protein
MGIIHDRLYPGVDGFDKFAAFFPEFLQANYHEVLAAYGVISDLRNIITSYWLPSTDLKVIKQTLIWWKGEYPKAFLDSKLFRPLGDGWSEAFAPFLVRFDFPFITPAQIPAVDVDEVDGMIKYTDKDTPLPDSNTLIIYGRLSHRWFNERGSVDELRVWAAQTAFLCYPRDENSPWLMANLTHTDISPLPDKPHFDWGENPVNTIEYALRLAAPTMDAKTWNTWFNYFLDQTKNPSPYRQREAEAHEFYLDATFYLLNLELKCPLNELKPMHLFSKHQGKLKYWCAYFHQTNTVVVSFNQFETCVKALQARVDFVNETLSVKGSRKRKAEKQ